MPPSFRPWALNGQGTAPLSDRLAQITAERGHFRDITEESLQAEIAAEESGQPSQSQSQSTSGDEEAEGEQEQEYDSRDQQAPPMTRQELYAVRQDLTTQAAAAHNDVLVMLDMVSLLQSTYTPAQAATTISPLARLAVPLSSLGADVWARTPADPARDAQDSLIATTVRAKYLSESADSLLSAATRLEGNVRKETQYWDQVLDISAKGWNVSRIPGQKQRLLGVHFGFSGSAKESAGRNIAALISDDEGNIKLERGVGTRPKAVRAIVKQGSRILGSSKLPILPDISETTLEARIRHARDSVFDEELFHEMIRESRTLLSRGVTMKGSTIMFDISPAEDSARLEFHLIPLDEDSSLPLDSSHESDALAQAALLAARLLLSQAHREKIKKQSQLPAPMMPGEDQTPPLPILRPILTMLHHCSNVLQINSYISRLEQLLIKANVSATVNLARVAILSAPQGVFNTEAILGALLQPLSAGASIEILSIPPFELATGTSIQDVVGFSFALIKGGKICPWDCVEDLIENTDSYFPDYIAQFIGMNAQGWTFRPDSGQLVRRVKSITHTASINLNGSAGTLQLSMGEEIAEWSLDDENAERRSILDTLADWTID